MTEEMTKEELDYAHEYGLFAAAIYRTMRGKEHSIERSRVVGTLGEWERTCYRLLGKDKCIKSRERYKKTVMQMHKESGIKELIK